MSQHAVYAVEVDGYPVATFDHRAWAERWAKDVLPDEEFSIELIMFAVEYYFDSEDDSWWKGLRDGMELPSSEAFGATG